MPKIHKHQKECFRLFLLCIFSIAKMTLAWQRGIDWCFKPWKCSLPPCNPTQLCGPDFSSIFAGYPLRGWFCHGGYLAESPKFAYHLHFGRHFRSSRVVGDITGIFARGRVMDDYETNVECVFLVAAKSRLNFSKKTLCMVMPSKLAKIIVHDPTYKFPGTACHFHTLLWWLWNVLHKTNPLLIPPLGSLFDQVY